MKTILFTLFIISSAVTFAQNTTQEEYNFMVKGYRHLVESGLDMKKGYYLENEVNFTTQDGKYLFAFKNLLRQKDKSIAGTIIVAKSNVSSKMYYLGIIAADSEGQIDLQNTLMKQIDGYYWDYNIKTAFIQALSEYLSLIMTQTHSPH